MLYSKIDDLQSATYGMYDLTTSQNNTVGCFYEGCNYIQMLASAVKILISVALFTGHSIATSGDVICEIYFNKLVLLVYL